MGNRGLSQRHLEAIAAMTASIEEAGGFVDQVNNVTRDSDYHGVRAGFEVAIPTDVKMPEDDG